MNFLKKLFSYFIINCLFLFFVSNLMAAEDLFLAAKTGNTILIEKLLAQKEDVNQQDSLGNTPLIYASSIGKEDTVKLLLQKKANPNIVNNDGNSPLIAACSANNFEIVKLLIKDKAKTDAKNKEGKTPLMFACINGNSEIVNYLLDKKANPNDTDKNGTSALMYATEKNKADIVKTLILRKASINNENDNKLTAFFIAARQGNLEIMKTLVAAGAKTNQPNINGITPFIACAALGNLDAIKYMVEELKTDINSKDNKGNNALIAAVAFMYSDLIKNVPYSTKDVANLDEAAFYEFIQKTKIHGREIMEYLITNGAYINNANNNGISPFTLAIIENDIYTAEYLKEKGVYIHITIVYQKRKSIKIRIFCC